MISVVGKLAKRVLFQYRMSTIVHSTMIFIANKATICYEIVFWKNRKNRHAYMAEVPTCYLFVIKKIKIQSIVMKLLSILTIF